MSDDRGRRQEALRGLMEGTEQRQHEAQETHVTPAIRLTPRRPRPRPSSGWRGGATRWLPVVAAALIIAVVVGAILRQSGLGAPKPAPALTVNAYALDDGGQTPTCPSFSAWSPDGRQVAVLMDIQTPLGNCSASNNVTLIQQSDSQGSSGSSGGSGGINIPSSGAFAIAVVDAATGHITRTIALPALTPALLCQGMNEAANLCGQPPVSAESVSWNLDGRSVVAFFTYTVNTAGILDNARYQKRGLLAVAPVNGASAPRLLIANGRLRAYENTPTTNDFYSPPRYTWNLSTGASAYADIQRGGGIFTTSFALGYHLSGDGALISDARPQSGDRSPWGQGMLIDNGDVDHPPYYSYQSSQWLWSPDGRYVSPNLDTEAYVSIPGVTISPPSTDFGLIVPPTIASPDAATTQAIKTIAPLHHNAALARNPNGRLLATYACGATDAQLTIRSVASGKVVAQMTYQYPLTSTSLGCLGDISPIAWSPDGAHIVSVDSADGQLIIWRVNVTA